MSLPSPRKVLFCGTGCMLLVVAGCQSAPRSETAASSPSAEPVAASVSNETQITEASAEQPENAVLLKPMGQLLGDAVVARREAGGPLPANYRSSSFAVSVLASLQRQYPAIFEVTERQAAQFRTGEFDDDANRRQVEMALSQIEQWDLPVTSFEGYLTQEYLAERYHAGELEGARLELAARLLRARMKAVHRGMI